jgi:hypothetical protein
MKVAGKTLNIQRSTLKEKGSRKFQDSRVKGQGNEEEPQMNADGRGWETAERKRKV